MWVAFLLLCCYLPLSAVAQDHGYGMTVDGEGTLVYKEALECNIRVPQLLFSASYIQGNVAERKTYVSAAKDCCYAKSTRNQCCRFFDTSGEIPVEKCKCAPAAACSACPVGMTSFEEKGLCVELITTAKDHPTAITQCANKLGSLAQVSSRSYQEFLEKTILTGHSSNVWIGVKRKSPNFRFTQTPNTNPTFTKWTSPITGGDCGALSYADSWNWDKVSCKSPSGFVCQKPTSGTCESTWDSSVPGSCIFLVKDPVGYGAAVSECKDKDAYLVQITSATDQTSIETLVTSETVDIWIGLRNMTDPDFTLTKDGNAISYYNWIPSRPTSALDMDCVMLDHTHSWRWSDANCTASYAYICESPALP